MPRYAVALRFSSDDDRQVLAPRLRDLVPDGEVTDDDAGTQLVFTDVESPVAALVRAQMLIHRACAGTDVAPSSVRRTPRA
ncbi:MAG TPA: hypothetical protein VHW26_08365 [Solirubrobacteraceae bacterium]|jgi:hypothetical protein|nr:hypothetical protein [Solirubrobacteraceae bacterium]